MIGIPYAEAVATPEPGQICPECGEFCPSRVDEEGETILDTYADHYLANHGEG